MSLKSRIQQNRISKLISGNNIELLDYFSENKDIDVLYIYSANKIYEEKNGIMQKSSFSFSAHTFYAEEIEQIIGLYGGMPEESEVKIEISNNVTMKIIFPPVISDGIYTVIRRRNKKNLRNLIISDEIISYLKECMKQKINIFIEGDAFTDKVSVLNLLANIQNKKIVIADKNREIKSGQPCSVRINDFYENIGKIPFDNIFINNADTNELIKIFRLILGGYKGFVVSLSLKENSDILASVRNMILIDSPNLFEENADFMSFSAMDVIVSAEKTPEGNTVISKVSEIFKDENGYSANDIFVFDKSGTHISTGIKSKFADKIEHGFSPEYFEIDYTHSYSENNTQIKINTPEIPSVFDYGKFDYKTDIYTKPVYTEPKYYETEDKEQDETNVTVEIPNVSKLDKLKKKLKDNKNRKEISEIKKSEEEIYSSESTQTKNPVTADELIFVSDRNKKEENIAPTENVIISSDKNTEDDENISVSDENEKEENIIPTENVIISSDEDTKDDENISVSDENEKEENIIPTENVIISSDEDTKEDEIIYVSDETEKAENIVPAEENTVLSDEKEQEENILTTEENSVISENTEQNKKTVDEITENTQEENNKNDIVIPSEDAVITEEYDEPTVSPVISENDNVLTEQEKQKQTEIYNIMKNYESNTGEQEDDIVEEDIQFVEEDDIEEKTTAPEPELFSEISEIDVENTPDEIFEIDDESI